MLVFESGILVENSLICVGNVVSNNNNNNSNNNKQNASEGDRRAKQESDGNIRLLLR